MRGADFDGAQRSRLSGNTNSTQSTMSEAQEASSLRRKMRCKALMITEQEQHAKRESQHVLARERLSGHNTCMGARMAMA